MRRASGCQTPFDANRAPRRPHAAPAQPRAPSAPATIVAGQSLHSWLTSRQDPSQDGRASPMGVLPERAGGRGRGRRGCMGARERPLARPTGLSGGDDSASRGGLKPGGIVAEAPPNDDAAPLPPASRNRSGGGSNWLARRERSALPRIL